MNSNKPFPHWLEPEWERNDITNFTKTTNKVIIADMLEETNQVEGDVIECGVHQGHSLAVIAAKLKSMGSKKAIWAFDSFQGLPTPTPKDKIGDSYHIKALQGYYSDTGVEIVKKRLEVINYQGGSLHLVPGWFHQTLNVASGPFSMIFLDCDLYESYCVCLNNLWPKLSKNGAVIFDEYSSLKYPGARKAINEFFAEKKEKPKRAEQYLQEDKIERWFVQKQ